MAESAEEGFRRTRKEPSLLSPPYRRRLGGVCGWGASSLTPGSMALPLKTKGCKKRGCFHFGRWGLQGGSPPELVGVGDQIQARIMACLRAKK